MASAIGGRTFDKTHPLLMSLSSADPTGTKLSQVFAGPLSAEARKRLIATRIVRIAVTCDDVEPVCRRIEDVGGKFGTVIARPKSADGPAIVLGDLPVDGIEKLAEESHVRYIYPSVKAKPLVDMSIPALWPTLGQIPTNLDGSGIVVGIVDSGIDWNHDDFRNSDGTTRIRNLLVQDLGAKREYSQAQIDAALNGQGVVPGDDLPEGRGHGTHVAGIAAGNGRASAGRFRGVAPAADLVVVRTDFDTNNIQAGVQWIFDKAAKAGLPAVVNLSLGTHFGPHDGTSAFERALENLSGQGRIIVAAAGNEGNSGIHSTGTVKQRWVTDFVISQPLDGTPPKILIDCWVPAGIQIRPTLRTPTGDLIRPSPAKNYAGRVITLQQARAENGDTNVLASVSFTASPTPADLTHWSLIFENNVESPDHRIHCWITETGSGRFTSGADPRYSVAEPANSRGALAVAAFSTKNAWNSVSGQQRPDGIQIGNIAFFSSQGPTRDERKKPEVACPGQMIVSSLSSGVRASVQNERVEASNRYQIMQGTSQAAPHLTGAIALLLQKHGPLTSSQVRQRVEKACYSDPSTGATWNDRWGSGKLSLQELLN